MLWLYFCLSLADAVELPSAFRFLKFSLHSSSRDNFPRTFVKSFRNLAFLLSTFLMSGNQKLPSIKDLLNDSEGEQRRPHGDSRQHGRQQSGGPSKDQSSSSSSLQQSSFGGRGSTIGSAPSLNFQRPDGGGSSHPSRSAHLGRQAERLPSVNEVLSGQVHRRSASRQYRAEDQMHLVAPSVGSGQKKPGFPCERCGRVFTRKSDAIKHVRVVHDRVMAYSCVVCGRKFARKDYCMVRLFTIFACFVSLLFVSYQRQVNWRYLFQSPLSHSKLTSSRSNSVRVIYAFPPQLGSRL